MKAHAVESSSLARDARNLLSIQFSHVMQLQVLRVVVVGGINTGEVPLSLIMREYMSTRNYDRFRVMHHAAGDVQAPSLVREFMADGPSKPKRRACGRKRR